MLLGVAISLGVLFIPWMLIAFSELCKYFLETLPRKILVKKRIAELHKLTILALAAVGALTTLSLTSCVPEDKDSADAVQARETAEALKEAQNQVGMPAINNWQQRKLMKLIYELCDNEDLVCYAYLQSAMTGDLIFVGKCMGYGIPFSAQFTNPERVYSGYVGGAATHYYSGTLPQADPNGLFMPTSSSASWLMMIDSKTNEPRPVYFEPTITVSPFPLHDEKLPQAPEKSPESVASVDSKNK